MRLTFPSFESRAEIARMVADRDVRERWPRDPDGAPLYPGRGARRCRRTSGRRASPRGEPYAIRLDMARRSNGPARCTGARPAPGPRGETRR